MAAAAAGQEALVVGSPLRVDHTGTQVDVKERKSYTSVYKNVSGCEGIKNHVWLVLLQSYVYVKEEILCTSDKYGKKV